MDIPSSDLPEFKEKRYNHRDDPRIAQLKEQLTDLYRLQRKRAYIRTTESQKVDWHYYVDEVGQGKYFLDRYFFRKTNRVISAMIVYSVIITIASDFILGTGHFFFPLSAEKRYQTVKPEYLNRSLNLTAKISLPINVQILFSLMIANIIFYTIIKQVVNIYQFWQRGSRTVTKQQKIDLSKGTSQTYI